MAGKLPVISSNREGCAVVALFSRCHGPSYRLIEHDECGANPTMPKANDGASLGVERQLWQATDGLRVSVDVAECKHVVLGLVSLKYISKASEERPAKLKAEKAPGADAENPDEYRAVNVFWVPPKARWAYLKTQAKQPAIGRIVDDAMAGVERDNPALQGASPRDYSEVTR